MTPNVNVAVIVHPPKHPTNVIEVAVHHTAHRIERSIGSNRVHLVADATTTSPGPKSAGDALRTTVNKTIIVTRLVVGLTTPLRVEDETRVLTHPRHSKTTLVSLTATLDTPEQRIGDICQGVVLPQLTISTLPVAAICHFLEDIQLRYRLQNYIVRIWSATRIIE